MAFQSRELQEIEKLEKQSKRYRPPLTPLDDQSDEENGKRRFIVCDIESAKGWVNFLVIGIYDGNKVHTFYKLADFISHVLDHYSGFDCFAHFGGNYDFMFILKAAYELQYKTSRVRVGTIIPRGNGILCFDLYGRSEKEVIHFRDSSALLPFGLKTLSETFDVKHKKQEIEYDKITKVTPELLEYLEYDLKGLYEIIQKYYSVPIIKKAGGAYTMASQALRLFRTYIDFEIKSLSKNRDGDIRPAYLGGRVEIFKPVYKGKSPLYCYDVNSLYPTVMKGNYFPTQFDYITAEWEPKKLGFYHAVVDVPKSLHIPPLGILMDGKYVFPTGKFKGFWSIAELNYAKSLGVKISTKAGYIFKNGGKIFESYITELWNIRKNAKNETEKTIAKLLMNSLYGRFGMDTLKENIILDDFKLGRKPLLDSEGEWKEIDISGMTFRLAKAEVELQSFTNVAIAAYVTSYARIHMHRLYSKSPLEIYYTDTDSMFTTKKYRTGDGLGDLKLEYTTHNACFLLPKTYITDEKIVMKGFDKKKIKHFTIDDFLTCLEGQLGLKDASFKKRKSQEWLMTKQDAKFLKFKSALKSGNLVNMSKESTRQINSLYDKRIIIKRGMKYETEAIHLGM